MHKLFTWIGLALLMLNLGACTSAAEEVSVAAGTPATLPPTSPPQSTAALVPDHRNTTYHIDGEAITLVDGVAELPAAPGSAALRRIAYFGNEARLDLNGDGQEDVAFLLVDDRGGTGSFFYAVGALSTAKGYQGTNAIMLGDRIAPQSTSVDPHNAIHFVVSYAERAPDAAMTTPPSVMVSRVFAFEAGLLVDVAPVAAADLPTAILGGWRATALEGAAPLPGSALILRFGRDGRVEAQACNSFGGDYTIDAEQLRFEPFMSTLMVCNPPAWDEQERRFQQALGATVTARVEGATLRLFDAAGQELLTFKRSL